MSCYIDRFIQCRSELEQHHNIESGILNSSDPHNIDQPLSTTKYHISYHPQYTVSILPCL